LILGDVKKKKKKRRLSPLPVALTMSLLIM